MKEEFGRADKILQHIFSGTKTWEALFERHSFFSKDHKYYLSVVAASRSKEASSTFSGLVQSKIRHIVKGVDDGQTGIDTARPYIEYFERVHRCKNEDQVFEVSQGVLDYMIPASEASAVGTPPANSEESIIHTTTFYIGLTLPADGSKSLDISYPVTQFRNYITDSELYDEKTMSIKVVHTRKYVFPNSRLQLIANLSALHFPTTCLWRARRGQRSRAKRRKRRTRKVLSASSPIQASTCVNHASLNPPDAHRRLGSNLTLLC
jgi:poly(A) polymerase